MLGGCGAADKWQNIHPCPLFPQQGTARQDKFRKWSAPLWINHDWIVHNFLKSSLSLSRSVSLALPLVSAEPQCWNEGRDFINEGSEKESHDPPHPHWPMILVTWRSMRTQCSGSCCAPTARFIKLIRRKEGRKKTIKRDAIGPFSPFAPIRLSEAVCWNTNRLRLRPTTADWRAQLQLSSSVAVYWMEWFVGRMKQREALLSLLWPACLRPEAATRRSEGTRHVHMYQ